MKKFIPLMFVISFITCNSFLQLSFDKELTLKIQSEYLEKKKPVDLIMLTDFDWDNYLFIYPYEIPNQVGKKYKVDLSNISEYVSADEAKRILVFIKNKKGIKICDLNSNILVKKNKELEIE